MPDTSPPLITGPHQFRNNQKMVPASETAWAIAQDNGMLGLRIRFNGSQNNFVDIDTGHEFTNMCSCSYLGLNGHPDVIEGGVSALREEGTTGLAMAEFRIRLGLMEQLESELSDLFGGPVLPAVTSSALTAGILPMLGSGHLTDSEPLVMVFDKYAHFSMAFVKPVVADETLVMTIPHNDLEALEDICRRHKRVAYVCDGVYSVGGKAKLAGLLALQEKYGLFLYIDDSHSLSTEGKNGEGHIRAQLPGLNNLTMIVASTAKAFGSTGGIAMLGDRKHYDFLYRSGPLGWSQSLRTASIGTSLGSIKVHRSPELSQLQQQLAKNIAYFDRHIASPQRGNGLHIKVIEVGENERAVALSKAMYRAGFYCSAVFFPIIPKGKAGIRLMLRGDMSSEICARLVSCLSDALASLDEEVRHDETV